MIILISYTVSILDLFRFFLNSFYFNSFVINAQRLDSLSVSSSDSSISFTDSLSSELGLYVRFIIALAIVIFLLILTLWIFRQILKFRGSGIADSAIDVLAIRYIEQKKSVALIRILDRVLIIGISDNSITTLGELSSEEAGSLNIDKKTEPGVFGNIISRFMDKKTVET